MSEADDGPYCPECGGPVSATATYCMHCDVDLTDRTLRDGSEATWTDDASDGGEWGEAPPRDASGEERAGQGGTDGPGDGGGRGRDGAAGGADDGGWLDPDGLVDNTLTMAVAVAGGVVVGLVGTVVLLVVTGSAWALPAGLLAWLVATAYLARRRTVQGAVSATAYGVAVVLALVPLVPLSPGAAVEGGLGSRLGASLTLGLVVAIPAVVAAGVGWVAARFVPEPGGEG